MSHSLRINHAGKYVRYTVGPAEPTESAETDTIDDTSTAVAVTAIAAESPAWRSVRHACQAYDIDYLFTQCPPGPGDVPLFTLSRAGKRLAYVFVPASRMGVSVSIEDAIYVSVVS
jgi:hypothetical protein